MCVSLTTLEATLIYSAKNGNQWTANGILFIFKKLKSCKSAHSIQKQLSKLTALYCTSYGHAHLLKFKVHFEGTRTQEHCSYWYECWGYGVVIIFSRLCALRVSTSMPSFESGIVTQHCRHYVVILLWTCIIINPSATDRLFQYYPPGRDMQHCLHFMPSLDVTRFDPS